MIRAIGVVPLAVRATPEEVELVRVETETLGGPRPQHHDAGAGIDEEDDGFSVDLGLEHEVTAGSLGDLDLAGLGGVARGRRTGHERRPRRRSARTRR